MRSSELWTDEIATAVVGEPEPLDLLLFNQRDDAWGAHLAVSVGAENALHLCKEVGRPTVWSLTDFQNRAEYQVLASNACSLFRDAHSCRAVRVTFCLGDGVRKHRR